MRIVRWHCHFIKKLGTQTLNSAPGRQIVRVAGYRDGIVNRADERGDRSTRLKRKSAPTERLRYLKSYVTSTDPNMLSISNPKIDVTDIRTIGSNDAELKKRDESARWLTGHDTDETQCNLASSQKSGRSWKHLFCGWCGHGANRLSQARRAGDV